MSWNDAYSRVKIHPETGSLFAALALSGSVLSLEKSLKSE